VEDDELTTEHNVIVVPLVPCESYTATLISIDEGGTSSMLPDALEWTLPGDNALIPDDAPDDADPCIPASWVAGDDDDDSLPPPIIGDDVDDGMGCSGCVASVGGLGGAGAFGLCFGLIVLIARRRASTDRAWARPGLD
jgi:hypothetical protein